MSAEAPKQSGDPFEGDAAYWARTNLTDAQRAALKDPASKLQAPVTGLRNPSSTSLPLPGGVEASDGAVAEAAAHAETVELPTFGPATYPGGEAGAPDRPALADVMGPELPPSHPQPE